LRVANGPHNGPQLGDRGDRPTTARDSKCVRIHRLEINQTWDATYAPLATTNCAGGTSGAAAGQAYLAPIRSSAR
jgi:hypothetical protein